jgi:hypothetical protein
MARGLASLWTLAGYAKDWGLAVKGSILML